MSRITQATRFVGLLGEVVRSVNILDQFYVTSDGDARLMHHRCKGVVLRYEAYSPHLSELYQDAQDHLNVCKHDDPVFGKKVSDAKGN